MFSLVYRHAWPQLLCGPEPVPIDPLLLAGILKSRGVTFLPGPVPVEEDLVREALERELSVAGRHRLALEMRLRKLLKWVLRLEKGKQGPTEVAA